MTIKTTVFCAVYSKDVNRAALLRSHYENLRSQSKEIELLYIFEANDALADQIRDARSFRANYAMTIYESWNLAVAMARTDYLMNLNLDDRLNHDAVELMEGCLEREAADLVGGDWKICFTQAETNAVMPNSYGVEGIEFKPNWPPIPGTQVRLGSGTGHRGTYGPATLWRASAHLKCPRYPYRTDKGYLIRSMGDAVWWTYLRNVEKKRLVRLPKIIGNYHSHPSEQAEFRASEDAFRLKTERPSRI